METFEIILIVVAGVIFAWLFFSRARVGRDEAMRAIAEAAGLSYSPGPERETPVRLKNFEVFRTKGMVVSHRIDGVVDVPHAAGMNRRVRITTGDASVDTRLLGPREVSTTLPFSFVAIDLHTRCDGRALIRRETMLDRARAPIGDLDIDFESAEFSRRFYVAAGSRKFAYDLIDPRMMQFLLDSDPPIIRIVHGMVLLTRDDTELSSEAIGELIAWAKQFVSHWPRHLLDW